MKLKLRPNVYIFIHYYWSTPCTHQYTNTSLLLYIFYTLKTIISLLKSLFFQSTQYI